MRELKSSEYSNVIELLCKEKVHCTFAYAVAEGKQPGRIIEGGEYNAAAVY